MTVFKKAAAAMGISLSERQLEQFEIYANELIATNKLFNLTAITDYDDIQVKHFADSISVLTAIDIKSGASLADIGCGAGFPGLPLKIVRPDIHLALLDGTGKKVNFLKELSKKLEIDSNPAVKATNFIHARAEEAARTAELREHFDCAVSRAVSYLPVLLEYSLPFVKVNGVFAAMKGADPSEEISASKHALRTLGAEISDIKDIFIPDTDIKHTIIVIQKTKPTLKEHPRAMAKIAKNSL